MHTNIDYEAIGTAIRAARETNGFTLRDVSRGAGVAEAIVCKYEHAERVPRLDHLERIARFLRLPLRDLLDAGCAVAA